MARQIQIRRGSATAHTNFTGAIGEVTMDTTNNTLRVHDGVTLGGTILAKQNEIPVVPDLSTADYVIESQSPTAENNYTWYRKYKSGWIEQGGHYTHNNVEGTVTITLPATMADTHYTITMSKELSSASNTDCAYEFMPAYVANSKTTTGFSVRMTAANRLNGADWEVKGLANQEI